MFKLKNIISSLMVWSCFWAGGLGPLVFIDDTMNQKLYIEVLLQYYIL
jgi:hypothetical protein